MDDIDSFLDSLLQQKSTPVAEVSWIEKKDANAIRLGPTSSKGEGIFAVKSFSTNSPICSLEYPKIAAINPENLRTTCYHCLIITGNELPLPSRGSVPVQLKTCNGCFTARFCTKDCQVEAWRAYHKYECKIFKQQQHNEMPAIQRAVLRTVLLQDRGLLSDEDWNRITAMTSHEHIWAGWGRSNITEMAEGIKHLAKSGMSIEMIQKLIFIMKFNAIELPTPISGSIGIMLNPLIAKLNHNCEPNVMFHRPQHTMISGWMNSEKISEEQRRTFVQVIPLREIEEGEELLNCYVVPTVSVTARKAKLLEDYQFECQCRKCQSDATAADNLTKEQPDASAQFKNWTKEVNRHLSRTQKDPNALSKAAAAMDKSSRFMQYPVLYTTGDFPDLAMKLIQEGINSQALDEALTNVLRIYFLVNPQRFVGRHGLTDIYTIFLMLDLFDSLLGVSTPPSMTSAKIEKCLKNLSTRGLSEEGLIYWRGRIGADLRGRLEGSGAKDLLVLVEKIEQSQPSLTGKSKEMQQEQIRDIATQEMRTALRLDEPTWTRVLRENGC